MGKFCGAETAPVDRFAQDPERSFEVNVRISIAATAGPLCSAAAVLIVGTVPLLLAGGGTCGAVPS